MLSTEPNISLGTRDADMNQMWSLSLGALTEPGGGWYQTQTQYFCLTVSLGAHKGGRGHFQSVESRNGFLEEMTLEEWNVAIWS